MKRLNDFNEKNFLNDYPELLGLLLIDRTTGLNIRFCTNDYSGLGDGFSFSDEIKFEKPSSFSILPRTKKSLESQKNRSRVLGEVFTPTYICNHQINLLDNVWFEENGAFNVQNKNTWEATEKLVFKKYKKWKDYVLEPRLEITCGEGPYLASRYDATTGFYFSVKNRVGLLDRKLRVVNEYISNESVWFDYVLCAYKSCYGFDFQGDNVFLTRISMLYTFIENYYFKFHLFPTLNKINKILEILSWNIFQMDGLNFKLPVSKESVNTISIDCIIMDWSSNNSVPFKSLFWK